MFVLDTNILSEMRKMPKNKANRGVEEWLDLMPKESLFISVITLMEIERGVLNMERKDPCQGKMLRDWLEDLVRPTFKGKTLYPDDITATLCAGLHIPDKSPDNDAWIAATALRHHFTLVTRNIKDFEKMGVKLLNPFIEN